MVHYSPKGDIYILSWEVLEEIFPAFHEKGTWLSYMCLEIRYWHNKLGKNISQWSLRHSKIP